MTDLFQFKVPATCAHLGPGFGVLAVAVDLFLGVKARRVTTPGYHVERPGAAPGTSDERHDAALRSLLAAADRFAIKLPPGLLLVLETAIPGASGLGSNAASFAAGIGTAARIGKKAIALDAALDLLVELGGDPAHGAAALRGGLTAASMLSSSSEKQRFHVISYPIHPSWNFVFALPDVHVGASDNRRILPPTLPHAVAYRTTSRTLGLLEALGRGEPDLLGPCLRDEVHVPFRRRLVPGLEAALNVAVEAGAYGATIAGHGPAVVAMTMDDVAAPRIARAMVEAFQAAGLAAKSYVLRAHAAGALP